MQLILTPPPKVMVILKEISFNCGSPEETLQCKRVSYRPQIRRQIDQMSIRI